MRVTREQADATRQRIVDTAARRFREKGYDGIGVADLMQAAGLTHGGFYAHFDSKEDLMAAACARALERSVDAWEKWMERGDSPLEAITAAYLSPRHRDHPGAVGACMIAAGGADIARLKRAVREAATSGVESQLQLLAGLLPGRTQAARRRKALAIYSGMLGALLLSRVVDDEQLSDDILQSARDWITGKD